jgi:signal transduction histidine kinase
MPESTDCPGLGEDLQPSTEDRAAVLDRLAKAERKLEELSASYDQLNQANLELLELDRLKSDFIGTVSHELKTPLTTLLGYVDYLQSGKLGTLTEQQSKAIDAMARSLRKLHRQIEELLDFTLLESGKLTVDPEPFELKPLLEEALAGQSVLLEKKGLKSRLGMQDSLTVNADRGRIAQVLDNLVVNAAKFTDKGEVTISAEPEPGKRVKITVSDTGAGIPEEALGRIFDRFYQVSGSASRRQAGMGLGLAIVKAIVEAHGSKIVVKSRVGQGSSFSFSLPLFTPGCDTRA